MHTLAAVRAKLLALALAVYIGVALRGIFWSKKRFRLGRREKRSSVWSRYLILLREQIPQGFGDYVRVKLLACLEAVLVIRSETKRRGHAVKRVPLGERLIKRNASQRL
ncbi:hypothetical protein AYO38_04130 [bacterium SCGC AG-212-C10]|nr:hypothetical protein AYO38_04130 [bacterium SCGC AG-212-C10]